MFVYVDYEKFKRRYHDAQHRFDAILKEKEELFSRTQPKSAKWDKIGFSLQSYNSFDDYLVSKEKKRIDERLCEIKSILNDREKLLNLKEIELRKSKNNVDVIYRMRYLDHAHITNISLMVHYSESQVYRILQSINGRCEKMRGNARL